MKLPDCPVCQTGEYLKVDVFKSTVETGFQANYHCLECGYRGVATPVAESVKQLQTVS